MKKNYIGALQVALAAISWSFAGVFSKACPWHPITLNGMRTLIAALLLGLVRGTMKVKLTRGNLLGAMGVALTNVLFMAATKLTTSANAIVLQYAMPAFVILFNWLFFRQRPSRFSLIVCAVIMLGVVLCSWGGLSRGNPVGDMLAILAGVAFALVFFCARMPGANATDYSYLGMLFCAPTALYAFADRSMTLEPLHWLTVLGLGLCLAGGYFFISLAMGRVSPVSAALLANLEPILNPVWVFLFVGEVPSLLTVLGAVVVITAVTVYSIHGSEAQG